MSDRAAMNRQVWYKNIRNAVVWNSGFALIPTILLFMLNRRITWLDLRDQFAYCWIYSNCIGGIAFALIPRVWVEGACLPGWLRWSFRVAAMMAACFAGCLVAGLVFVGLKWMPGSAFWPQFFGSFQLAAFLTIIAGVTMGIYGTLQARLEETTLALRTKEFERERALKLATEAQLASLESRIHPHFLFNTLNSISSLIPEDPARAERLLEQMAALLRFSLDASHSGLVPLQRELKIVQDYLEIERARFGDRLRYEIHVPAELNDSQVPPLSLQTLVENSVKHAIAPERLGGDILITASRSGDAIRLEVSDCGPAFNLESAPAGHGLDNLRGRLATLFGTEGSLRLERLAGRNQLTLSLPQIANEHAGISR